MHKYKTFWWFFLMYANYSRLPTSLTFQNAWEILYFAQHLRISSFQLLCLLRNKLFCRMLRSIAVKSGNKSARTRMRKVFKRDKKRWKSVEGSVKETFSFVSALVSGVDITFVNNKLSGVCLAKWWVANGLWWKLAAPSWHLSVSCSVFPSQNLAKSRFLGILWFTSRSRLSNDSQPDACLPRNLKHHADQTST